jgi:hypothetical protein
MDEDFFGVRIIFSEFEDAGFEDGDVAFNVEWLDGSCDGLFEVCVSLILEEEFSVSLDDELLSSD